MQPTFHIPDEAPLPDPGQLLVDYSAVEAKLREENKTLRELLDLFEHYCEFRMSVRTGIRAKDIPTLRDINKARKILGYQEITLPKGA